MYVVHDVVDDYPELASIAIGDLEERHVVIYRIGFHPVGMIPYNYTVCIIPYVLYRVFLHSLNILKVCK